MNLVCQIFGHNFQPKKRNANDWKIVCNRRGCVEEYNVYYDKKLADVAREYKYKNVFWDSQAWEIVKMVVILLIVLLSLITVFHGIVSLLYLPTCNQYANMGIETRWGFWTMCMAKHPEFGWVPVDKYFEIINLYVK